MKILIADDEEGWIERIACPLLSEGYDVKTVDSLFCVPVFHAIIANKPDVVIMDTCQMFTRLESGPLTYHKLEAGYRILGWPTKKEPDERFEMFNLNGNTDRLPYLLRNQKNKRPIIGLEQARFLGLKLALNDLTYTPKFIGMSSDGGLAYQWHHECVPFYDKRNNVDTLVELVAKVLVGAIVEENK